jgi:hypothetical protein
MGKDLADSLNVLGTAEFELEGEYSQVVTFLNKTLKDKNLIFGLRRTPEGRLCLTVYQVGPE